MYTRQPNTPRIVPKKRSVPTVSTSTLLFTFLHAYDSSSWKRSRHLSSIIKRTRVHNSICAGLFLRGTSAATDPPTLLLLHHVCCQPGWLYRFELISDWQ